MSNKQTGIITFKMIVTQGLEVTETFYKTEATLFLKNDQYYLFYNESSVDDESITKCRYEFTENELRIRRQGNVVIEQNHKIGQRTVGYMKTQYGNLDTVIKTHQLTINNDDLIEIVLDYDLYISNERTGNYKLTMFFNKEEN